MSKIRYLFWIVYTQPLYIIWLTIILVIVFWAFLMIILQKYSKIMKVLNGTLWVGCSLAIIFNTLLTRNGTVSQIKLLPFYSFKEAIEYPEMYRAMVMNIFLFIPFGLTLPYVLPEKIKKMGVFTCSIAAVFSLVIELFQLFFCLGRCEIDDIIMNTVGALVGVVSYFIYKWMIGTIGVGKLILGKKGKEND